MKQDGGTEFIEVGPGNVLQGLVKRIAPDVAIAGIGDQAVAEHFNAGVA